MKRSVEVTEKRTEDVQTDPTFVNQFHDRAMTLIEEQLPIAIALGRESSSANLLFALHSIVGGTSNAASLNAACTSERISGKY